MRDDDSNWFSRWEQQLPSPEELMPLSQSLITPDLALAFDIRTPSTTAAVASGGQLPPPSSPSGAIHSPLVVSQLNSSEFAADSSEFGSGSGGGGGGGGDEQARTLKRPRLVWTPQLHKRFVEAVAQLGIKNAVPKTIMQLMNVDGLTRENVASHLQKYRLYLKRTQGFSGGGDGGSNGGAACFAGGSDAATDHLFASGPVPAHFLHPGRANSDPILPYVPLAVLQQHHHQQQVVPGVGRPQLQSHYYNYNGQGHFGSSLNGQFENPFIARHAQQPVHMMGATLQNSVPGFVEDLESANKNGGRKILTLFPTGED